LFNDQVTIDLKLAVLTDFYFGGMHAKMGRI